MWNTKLWLRTQQKRGGYSSQVCEHFFNTFNAFKQFLHVYIRAIFSYHTAACNLCNQKLFLCWKQCKVFNQMVLHTICCRVIKDESPNVCSCNLNLCSLLCSLVVLYCLFLQCHYPDIWPSLVTCFSGRSAGCLMWPWPPMFRERQTPRLLFPSPTDTMSRSSGTDPMSSDRHSQW